MAVKLSADDQVEYWLGRDFLSSARLSYQHGMCIARTGYLLHPSIVSAVGLDNRASQPSSRPIQVLDLATGNGIWAIDFAASVHSSGSPIEVTGLDVSADQFPPRESWPANVKFDTYDFFEEVPDQYVEKFDIVHIRFIIAPLIKGVSARDRAIHSFTRMLKPGGYLQWMEGPPPIFHPVSFHPDGSISIDKDFFDPAFKTVDKYTKVWTNIMWTHTMDKVVSEVAGYVDAKTYYPPLRKDRLKYETDLLRWNATEGRPGLVKMVKDEAARREITDASEKQINDIATGKVVYALDVAVLVARKPL